MHLFKEYRDVVISEIDGLVAAGRLPAGLDTGRLIVEPPRDPTHGDLSTNAAMVLAKPAGLKPRDLAESLAQRLAGRAGVVSAEVAGPGFINLRLDEAVWHGLLADVLRAGKAYGMTDIGGGEKVNVEYVSTNPTGPLHVGHARGTVFGDALAALLEHMGYDVTREYYINDAGTQVDMLARSVHMRYRAALGEDVGEIPEDYYPGDYLIPVGEALAARDGDKWRDGEPCAWLPEVRRFAVDRMMTLIREDLATLGVRHDVFTSERALVEAGRVDEVMDVLDKRGLIYTGVLESPKGKKLEDWEPRPQILFRATRFGDDVDRPLKKSDGGWTYFASDIANHLDKFRRGFARMIDVWGADHGGYIKRMQAAVKAVSDGKADLDIKICQIVRLLDKGEPVKMSKRAGSFVTLRDLVAEVGKDVLRFIMLTRKNDAPLDFDLTAVMQQSKDNPVFYVQYAHARVCSLRRHAAEQFADLDLSHAALAAAPLHRLTDPGELALIKTLANWPRLLEGAAEAHEPHRLAFYLYDLAAALHGQWTRGKDNPSLRFLVADDVQLTVARLALVRAVAMVIGTGLGIFGVEPAEEMR